MLRPFAETIPAVTVAWSPNGRSLAKLGHAFRDPQDSLLEQLGRAARLFAPSAESLAVPKPESLAMDEWKEIEAYLQSGTAAGWSLA